MKVPTRRGTFVVWAIYTGFCAAACFGTGAPAILSAAYAFGAGICVIGAVL